MFLKLSPNIVGKLLSNVAIYYLVGTELKRLTRNPETPYTQVRIKIYFAFSFLDFIASSAYNIVILQEKLQI